MPIQSGSSFGQHMVNQGPRFDRMMKKSPRRPNQVIARKGTVIRPDKRKKPHYL